MKKFTFTWSRTDSFEHTVEAETEEEARKIFESGEYNFNFSHDFAPDNEPEECEIQSIEEA